MCKKNDQVRITINFSYLCKIVAFETQKIIMLCIFFYHTAVKNYILVGWFIDQLKIHQLLVVINLL